MPLYVTWEDMALRLFLTIVAGVVLGFNREAGGHAAGFRTTLLVALASCLAMLQANILLSTRGSTPESFANLDIMRLPLGILTGVGFIGGGSIIKRGNLIRGVTTAATLWTATIIGLCFGGGQIMLGITGTLLSILILWALRWVDIHIPREHRARLIILSSLSLPPTLDVQLKPLGYRAHFQKQEVILSGARHFVFEVQWKRKESEALPQTLLEFLDKHYQLHSFELITEATDHPA